MLKGIRVLEVDALIACDWGAYFATLEGEDVVSCIDIEIQPFVDASGKTGTLAARFAIDSVREVESVRWRNRW